MRPRITRRGLASVFVGMLVSSATPAQSAFVNFESQQVHPVALTTNGKLLAVNTPDGRLSVFSTNGGNPIFLFDVPVGIEPVSVAVESSTRAWVVNHVSDTVSIVDLTTGNVVETLAVGDEPTDVLFANGKAFVCVSQEDAVKIYNPAALANPPVVVPIFGSDPRSLARSHDGQKVYVGIFESGNRTTIATSQDVVAHGGLPAPNPPGRPNVALVLRHDGTHWVDELGRNYDATHPFTLPDHDVAVLDATVPNPAPTYLDGLGTLLFDLAVHPASGKLYISNTDALNHVRFEPSLRGKFLRTRLTIVDPAAPNATAFVDLNPHINLSVTPGPQGEIDASLSQPGSIVIGNSGRIYLAALGSAKVAELDAAGAVTTRIPVGEGPSGLALDETNHRLYVLNRFANTVSVVDTDTRAVDHTISVGYDPSPATIRNGRRFLYDARLSSGHGDLACASCHAGGNLDGIAWDLGDPNGSVQPVPPGMVDPLLTPFHPMKGPMVTQSLRGLAGTQPFHWRADRADFEDFNAAFVSLMGRGQPLSASDMQAFKDFVFSMKYPPNPNQNLDRSFPNPPTGPSAERGRQAFINTPLDGPFRCVDCHALPSGTNGQMVNAQALQETQDMKIPQLRNLYEKTGFDYLPGAKKRGFGFVHDGTIATLFDFLRLPVFSFGSNDGMRRDVEAFLLAFDTGMAPAVGAQRTVHAGNQNATVVVNWINTMIAQSGASNIDLVVKGRLNGVARGWVYASNNQFRSDLASEPLIDKDALRALAGTGSELTYTGVPPGTGLRIGIDRDEDGAFDRTEIAAGSDPTDPASLPGATAVGPNEDAVEGARWVGCFPNPAPNGRTTLAFEVPVRQHVTLHIYDARGRVVRTLVDGDAGPGLVRVPWDGSDQGGRRAASGKYFLRLESSGRTVAQPLLLVR